MKNILSLSSVLTFLLAGNLFGTNILVTDSVAVGPDPARNFVTSSGATLPVGSIVRLGFFDDPTGNNSIITSSNLAAINAIFQPLGTEAGNPAFGSGSLTINAAGIIGSQTITGVQVDPNPLNGVPTGTQLFLWVFNAPTAASASEWGIFAANDTSWLAPANSLANISLGTFQLDDPSEILTGQLSGDQLRLEAVPEPSAAILLASFGAALGLIRRRRS